jgi:hypothetical protein
VKGINEINESENGDEMKWRKSKSGERKRKHAAKIMAKYRKQSASK